MKFLFGNPDLQFYLFDLALAIGIYGISIVLFMKQKRTYLTPLIFFGLFVFPLQFSRWFLSARVTSFLSTEINIFEIFYLIFLKLCLIFSVMFSRR